MVSSQLSFKIGKYQIPCITFGWLIFYVFITSLLFGFMGAKYGTINPETGETTKRNWQAGIASVINVIVFILFLLGFVLGCKCNQE